MPQATSLVKALRILQALEASPQGRGVSDIARELGMPKSAAHRLLGTFVLHGFVQQRPDRRYVLGPALVRLGLRAAEMFTPRRVARQFLEALAQETGETVFLGLLAQESVLVIDKVESAEVLRISPPLGSVLPLWQTALGKLLLAFCSGEHQQRLLDTLPLPAAVLPRPQQLDSIRRDLRAIAQQGFAVSTEEWRPDICCLAVPVRQGQGEAVAALALALPRSRMPQPQGHDPFGGSLPEAPYGALLPPLRSAAAQISAALP